MTYTPSTSGAAAVAKGATPLVTGIEKRLSAADQPRPVVMALHQLNDDLADLFAILGRHRYLVRWRTDLADALPAIRSASLPLVICESKLPDGNWRDLLGAASLLSSPPLVIVAARHVSDDLWGDVLNGGGYDVLTEPFKADEVIRVVTNAVHWWQNNRSLQSLARNSRRRQIAHITNPARSGRDV